ncbi:hypothetical protein FDUTEX481_09039 [Tolypothrix sp. PCC 7601]|nr:hypothetical protein FDUTEX481_09039 [Tolypothrix sp. PCC 7601]
MSEELEGDINFNQKSRVGETRLIASVQESRVKGHLYPYISSLYFLASPRLQKLFSIK